MRGLCTFEVCLLGARATATESKNIKLYLIWAFQIHIIAVFRCYVITYFIVQMRLLKGMCVGGVACFMSMEAISASDAHQDHALLHDIERIVITGSPFAVKIQDTASSVSMLGGEDKVQRDSFSLGATLNHFAGIDSIDTGGQAGKPVIRGLSGNRIRVLNNGIAQDFQQFGVRHPPKFGVRHPPTIDLAIKIAKRLQVDLNLSRSLICSRLVPDQPSNTICSAQGL